MNSIDATTTNTATETQPEPQPQTAREVPYFKAKCNRAGIHVPGDNPTPSEIIPIIQQRLAAHQNHIGKTMNPWTGDYFEWKSKHDDLTAFLQELQAAAKFGLRDEVPLSLSAPETSDRNQPSSPMSMSDKKHHTENFTKKSAQSTQPLQPQQNTAQTEPGRNPDDPGLTQTESGQAQTQRGIAQTQPGPAAEPKTHSAADTNNSTNTNQEVPPKLTTNDEELLEAAADLPLRLKGRSRFDQLTAEQQAAIISMMDVYTAEAVRKLIAQPPPTGFSLKIGRASLYDFRSRYKKREAERRKESLQQNAYAALNVIREYHNPDEAFLKVYENLLQAKALIAASDTDAPLADLHELTTTITKLRKQTLAERKQRHAESK